MQRKPDVLRRGLSLGNHCVGGCTECTSGLHYYHHTVIIIIIIITNTIINMTINITNIVTIIDIILKTC